MIDICLFMNRLQNATVEDQLEIFKEIIKYLNDLDEIKFALYVTCPEEFIDKINELLESHFFKYNSIPVENRGRDILPFLRMLPQIFEDGHPVILKIHTKKSDHRRTGELWRKDLYDKLLKDKAVKQAVDIFNKDHSVGLIGVPGHVVPMSLYYGANARMVQSLSLAMGVSPSQFRGMNFSAGSMFYARRQALLPLLELGLQTKDFEDELGQRDGTLAHAVERAFAISTMAANMKLVDMTYSPQKQNLAITKDHPFTY